MFVWELKKKWKKEKKKKRGLRTKTTIHEIIFVNKKFSTFQIFFSLQNYKDKDAGKVVVYTTSMGIVRSTYAKCQSVKQILRTLLVKFEERDVYMSNEYQDEVKDRMLKDEIDIPQLFVNGQHIGVSIIILKFSYNTTVQH